MKRTFTPVSVLGGKYSSEHGVSPSAFLALIRSIILGLAEVMFVAGISESIGSEVLFGAIVQYKQCAVEWNVSYMYGMLVEPNQ